MFNVIMPMQSILRKMKNERKIKKRKFFYRYPREKKEKKNIHTSRAVAHLHPV